MAVIRHFIPCYVSSIYDIVAINRCEVLGKQHNIIYIFILKAMVPRECDLLDFHNCNIWCFYINLKDYLDSNGFYTALDFHMIYYSYIGSRRKFHSTFNLNVMLVIINAISFVVSSMLNSNNL